MSRTLDWGRRDVPPPIVPSSMQGMVSVRRRSGEVGDVAEGILSKSLVSEMSKRKKKNKETHASINVKHWELSTFCAGS